MEVGTDPALVAGWARQVQREKAALDAQVATAAAQTRADRRMTAAEIRQLVDAMGGLLQVLRRGAPQ